MRDIGEELIRLQIKARDAEIGKFAARLQKILSISLLEVLKELKAGKVQAAAAASVLLGIEEVMRSHGLDKELATIESLYSEELNSLNVYFTKYLKKAQVFTETDIVAVEQMIKLDVARTTTVLSGYVDDVRSVMLAQIITGEAPQELAELIETVSGRAASVIETETATTLSGFASSINMRKAADIGLTLFKYQGPDDKITRPFCHHVLEKHPAIYSKAEIDRMDNGQGLPVAVYGGGYNCRHQWGAVDDQLARELGYGH